jgi:hypothetical protein
LLCIGCKKDQEDPLAPKIEFVSISETEVVSFNNEVYITIRYEDQQGDLGNEDPDILSLRVKDARLADPDLYHVPPMTPNGEALNIKGEYRVKLNTLFLLGTGSLETTSFQLQIRDRAGNWSNTIETTSINIIQ